MINNNFSEQEASSWDADYFKLFSRVGDENYFNRPEFVPKSFSEFETLLSPKFSNPNAIWLAKIVFNNKTPVARYLLYFVDNESNKLNSSIHFGYFESAKEEQLLDYLKKTIDNDFYNFTQKISNKNIDVIGPINGNVYFGSRFKENQNDPQFWGELVHQHWYPEFWSDLGFKRDETWYTYKIEKEDLLDYLFYLNKIFSKKKDPTIKIKNVKKISWKSDLFCIFNIMKSSFGFELNSNQISFNQFLKVSSPLKLLYKNSLSKILFKNNEPLAFSICYFDILTIWKKLGPKIVKSKGLVKYFYVLGLMFSLRTSRLPLMAVFTGKIPTLGLKGAMARLSIDYIETYKKLEFPYFLVIFNSEYSKSHSTLPESKKLYSTHYIMRKKIFFS